MNRRILFLLLLTVFGAAASAESVRKVDFKQAPEETDPKPGLVQRTFHGQKDNGDTSVYHYRMVRPSEEGVWKLEQAWRTSSDGSVVEEYLVRVE